jgi:hypothetical protein
LNSPPHTLLSFISLSPDFWNSFNRYPFCIYILCAHIFCATFTLLLTPLPTTDLFHPPVL